MRQPRSLNFIHQRNGNHSKHNTGYLLADNRFDRYKDIMKDWKPSDYIVMFLALVIGTMLLMTAVNGMIKQTELSEKKIEMIMGLIGSLVAIISIYVGAKIQQHKKDDDK